MFLEWLVLMVTHTQVHDSIRPTGALIYAQLPFWHDLQKMHNLFFP